MRCVAADIRKLKGMVPKPTKPVSVEDYEAGHHQDGPDVIEFYTNILGGTRCGNQPDNGILTPMLRVDACLQRAPAMACFSG